MVAQDSDGWVRGPIGIDIWYHPSDARHGYSQIKKKDTLSKEYLRSLFEENETTILIQQQLCEW